MALTSFEYACIEQFVQKTFPRKCAWQERTAYNIWIKMNVFSFECLYGCAETNVFNDECNWFTVRRKLLNNCSFAPNAMTTLYQIISRINTTDLDVYKTHEFLENRYWIVHKLITYHISLHDHFPSRVYIFLDWFCELWNITWMLQNVQGNSLYLIRERYFIAQFTNWIIYATL